MYVCVWQLEIHHLEAMLVKLQNNKKEIMANILTEEEHIRNVEEEMYEERRQLESERVSFLERQDKLAIQQVRLCTAMQVPV